MNTLFAAVQRQTLRWLMPILPRLVAALFLGVLAHAVHAQIAFRAAATGTALVPTLRAATTSGIAYRGAATTPAGTTSLAPVYRAAASASAASGTTALTITKPAGTIESDVMVAAIGVSANAPTITPPVGWTLVRRMTNAVATANSLAVYIKVATATEPANYQWDFSASGGSAGGIQTFYNVDILTPVDAESGQTTVSGVTHATPSITTTMANTMLVTSYTFSSSRSWNTPLAPPAPAVTERVDVRSNGNNATGQSTAAHQGIVATAGVVPALTATASANADTGNTHVLALRPALRVPRLATTATGDFMVAAIGVQPSTATVTAPAGWTLVNRIDNAAATSNSLVIYRKFALAGEPASYLWQLSGATAAVAGIQSFVGVDATTPVDAQNGQATASSLTHTAPSITTTVENALLVGHYTFASAATWMPPVASGGDAVMAESYDVASQGAGAAGQSLEGTRVVHAAIGATVVKPATALANADAGAAHIMALRPSATSVAIGLPGGTVANDVLIASIGIAWSAAAAPVVTPPAGWTLVRQIDNNNATRNSLVVFRRTAAAGEPAAYEFGVTNAAYMVGGIQGFYNVDTTAPVDVENGQATASGRDHATPTIATTTVANATLVGSYTYASSQTWTPQTPPTPAMTESFDKPSGAAAATGQSIEGTRLVQSAVGAVPAYTSRAAGAAATYDRGNTHILALRSPSPLLVINKPTGTVANDVMIASIGVAWNGTAAPVATPPTGWTLVRQIDNNTATRNSLFIYRKVDGGSEPASYTWNFTNFSFATGGIQSFSGVNTTTPINVENGALTANALTHATPSVTTTMTNTMLVASHTYASSGTWTPPPGMTEGFDVAAWTAPNALGLATEASYVFQATAGATGTKTATASANADRGNAHLLALRPIPVIPPVAPWYFNGCESTTCTPAATPLTYAALYTKLAGTAFTLQGVALKSDGTLEPGFYGDVAVDLLANINEVAASAPSYCPASQDATISLGNANFSFGRATITAINIANAYRDVRMRFTCSAAVCGSAITQCSTDNFAVRPQSFTVTANLGGTTLPAGNDFTMTATTAVVGSGYTGTLSLDTALLRDHNNSAAGTFNGSFGAATGSSATGTTFKYHDVGTISLLADAVTDITYTNADNNANGDCVVGSTSNTLSGGKYGCNVGSVAAGPFGRFYPHHFTYAATLTPACNSSFTYMDQAALGVSLTLSAKSAGEITTTRYTAGYATLGTFSITGDNGGAAVAISRLSPVLPAFAWSNGVYTVTGDRSFTRGTSADGPFDSFALKATVTDPDGATITGATLSNTTSIRYGRLKIGNAYGSELLPVRLPIRAEYYNGTGWSLNVADACTPIAVTNVAIGNCRGSLTSQCTGVGGTPNAGAMTPSLPATTLNNGTATLILTQGATKYTGSVDLALNLRTGAGNDQSCMTWGTTPGSTGANLPWLRFDWCAGATVQNDPNARANFGSPKAPYIYRRERY